MIFRLSVILLFTAILLAPPAVAQETVVVGEERDQMIRDVFATWPNKFKAITISSMTRLDDKLVRIDYLSEGNQWETVIQFNDTDPILVETALVLPSDQWPDFIVAAWKRNAPESDHIARILKVSTPYGKHGYRVESLPDPLKNGSINSLYFDSTGRLEEPFF